MLKMILMVNGHCVTGVMNHDIRNLESRRREMYFWKFILGNYIYVDSSLIKLEIEWSKTVLIPDLRSSCN